MQGHRSIRDRVDVTAWAGVIALFVLALGAVQIRTARRRFDGVLSSPGPLDVTVVPQDPAPVHVVGRAESRAATPDVLRQVTGQGSAPDVVVLMVGTNDVTHMTPIWRLAKHTAAVLVRLGGLRAPVVMSSLPEFRAVSAAPPVPRVIAEGRAARVPGLHRRVIGNSAVDLADERGLVGEEFVVHSIRVSADRFHPSVAWYVRIADVIAPAVAAAAVRDRPQSRTAAR